MVLFLCFCLGFSFFIKPGFFFKQSFFFKPTVSNELNSLIEGVVGGGETLSVLLTFFDISKWIAGVEVSEFFEPSLAIFESCWRRFVNSEVRRMEDEGRSIGFSFLRPLRLRFGLRLGFDEVFPSLWAVAPFSDKLC